MPCRPIHESQNKVLGTRLLVTWFFWNFPALYKLFADTAEHDTYNYNSYFTYKMPLHLYRSPSLPNWVTSILKDGGRICGNCYHIVRCYSQWQLPLDYSVTATALTVATVTGMNPTTIRKLFTEPINQWEECKYFVSHTSTVSDQTCKNTENSVNFLLFMKAQ
jgi:hypothetical protein